MIQTFQYLQPKSPREACKLKAKYGQKAVFWAGGTDLLLEWKGGAANFEYCINLSNLNDLSYIHEGKKQTNVGALTTIGFIENYSGFNHSLSVLPQVALDFATPQIRNTATVGGNLCHAVPSADYALPLIALSAQVKILAVSGERTMPLTDFFIGVKQTALEIDELLIEISIPSPPPHTVCTFQRVGRSSVDIALVNVAVSLTLDKKEKISQARIALGAVAPTPFRSESAEELLIGHPIQDLNVEFLEKVGRQAAAGTRPISDVRTSASYRKEISKVLVKRALVEALRQLQEIIK